MKKNTTLIFFLVSVILVGAYVTNFFDKSQLDKGLIGVSYNPSKSQNIRLVVTKGKDSYNYLIEKKGSFFPLQSGNGSYVLTLAENISGNKYKVLKQETVQLKLDKAKENLPYLQPVHNVYWNDQMDCIKKAKELTKDAKTDLEKVNIIYNYVTTNVKYDYEKAKTVKGEYVPLAEETFKINKGICYDYAGLTGAMLRSLDIPCKIEMGYKDDIKDYHAWNSVYLADSKTWHKVDTTYDAIYIQGGQAAKVRTFKDDKLYTVAKHY